MQVASTQAARAFAALRAGRRRAASRRRRRGATRVRPGRAIGLGPTTLERAVRSVEAQPRLRRERVVDARRRLDAGDHPSADEVADMIVRRAVCDRLR
ncbi:MAG TPA: hypothetical protein VIL48_11015 [Acidimicrobiales bacterium]